MSHPFGSDVGASSNSFNQKKKAMLNGSPIKRFEYKI